MHIGVKMRASWDSLDDISVGLDGDLDNTLTTFFFPIGNT